MMEQDPLAMVAPVGGWDHAEGLARPRGQDMAAATAADLNGRGYGRGYRWDYPSYDAPADSREMYPYSRENLEAQKEELQKQLEWLNEQIENLNKEN